MTQNMTDEELALQLIKTIREKTAPRATLLESRIEKARNYLDEVSAPNTHTLDHLRRFFDGEYDDMSFHDPAALLRNLFQRRWVCEVFTSGYHNGCTCDPDEPHGGWNCGYRWVAGRLTENEAREYGIITDTTEETTT